MIRKLAVALSLTTALSASVVQALGLGEASVESSLNQPLKAEIELVNIRDLEDNEILPGLASREEFLKAGVERIYFLSDVRFEVEHKADGRVVVNLTTNKPVREPFLNFLVEVIWPSGRLLREYALLIDPPIYSEEPLAPVQQVESSPATRTSTSTAPASATVAAETTAPRSTVSTAPSSTDTYGPTNNSDTMWAIALKVRPDNSVTAQQTMLAIQELNQDSFINNNINSLKTGQVLRLPGLNEIRQLSKRDAVRGVITQNRRFENKPLSRNVVDAAPVDNNVQQANTPEVVQSPKASGDELKLVVAEGADVDQQSGAHAGESVTDGSSSALKNDLDITLEKLDQSNLEKKELNSRVTDLEEQLETLQRLLTLKDDQLANLQTQMGQSDDSVAEVEVLPQPDVVNGDGQVSAVPDSEETQNVTENTADTPAETTEALAPASVSSEVKPIKADVVDTPPAEVQPVASVIEEPATTKPLSFQSVLDLVLNNPIYQALAGGIVVLLLLIVWALSRRNAQKEQEFFETRNDEGEEPGDIFDVDTESDISDSENTSDEIDDVVSASDDEVTNVQSETEDVIAEADIYIAYGRLDQASQLLENAISSEPQRIDTRIKLLEVYAESNEIESFNKQFNEIEALNDDYALEQAAQIRAGLEGVDASVSIDDLESQLLSGEPVEPAEPEGRASIEYEAPELSDLESELELDTALEINDSLAEEDDLDIDFDINEIDLDSDDSEIDGSSSDDLDLDLESDDLSVSLEESELELSVDDDLDLELEEEPAELVDDLDLDLDLDLALSTDDTPVDVGSELDDDLELGLDESDLDLGLDEVALDDDSDTLNLEESEEEISLDDGELSLDDLDLELDKIDSDLDVNFDAEVDEVESDELVELEGDLNLEVEEAAIEELEDIVDVLAGDNTLDEVSVDDLELDTTVTTDVDDSLLESAEIALDEGDGFESELTEEEDFDFLAGTDEAATKLDLARAYIDMGDADGAKDILEEVSLEGNNEQKQDAQDLLKTLD